MLRGKLLTLCALVFSAGLASAQTGPSTGPTNTGPTPGGPTPVLTPERLTTYLKGQGHVVDQKKAANGAITLLVHVQKDGWKYQLEFEYYLDQKNFNMVCPVGAATTQFSAAQLLELLKASHRLIPVHFSFREADRRLCLELPNVGTFSNETQFQVILDLFQRNVRDTYHLWDASRWPVTGQNPAPSTTPSPAPKLDPAPAKTLAGSNWVGSEDLDKYGKLEFRFQADGKATMVDNDGTHTGTYTVDNNNVTMSFYNGGVVYTGTISGQKLAGTARNSKGGTWNFSVSR